jgi:hypothetical protein
MYERDDAVTLLEYLERRATAYREVFQRASIKQGCVRNLLTQAAEHIHAGNYPVACGKCDAAHRMLVELENQYYVEGT